MRRPATKSVFIVAIGASFLAASMATASAAVDVTSPGGKVTCQIDAPAGQLTLSIALGDAQVVEPSAVHISVDGKQLADACALGAINRGAIDETYPWRGPHSTAVNRCTTAAIEVKPQDGSDAFVLEVRAFDDGVAFRHIVAAASDDQSRVPDEATTFVLPAGSTVWRHDLEGHYESVYKSSAVEEMEQGEWAGPPMTYRLKDGAAYASITEAALVNYSGMALQAAGDRKFTLALAHNHPASYPFRLRYEDDVERMKQPAPVVGRITSPWRVVLVAPTSTHWSTPTSFTMCARRRTRSCFPKA